MMSEEGEKVVPRVVAATGHAIRARWDVEGEGASLAAGSGSAQGSAMRKTEQPLVASPAPANDDAGG